MTPIESAVFVFLGLNGMYLNRYPVTFTRTFFFTIAAACFLLNTIELMNGR